MNREARSALVPSPDKQAEEDPWQRYGAERGIWTESMLNTLARGEEGTKWFSLIDKVRSMRTLEMAWAKVQSNAGASGVDGISVVLYSKDSQNRLLAVNEQLRQERYQPKAIRRVYIPKAGSNEKRPLGIPTVKDRVVQTALKMVIQPIFEATFAPTSYGFRPGRGCKDALREVERLLHSGYTHIVDVDIKGYFDNIPHAPLMKLVKERIADGKVLGLIEAFLRQPVEEPEDKIASDRHVGLITPEETNEEEREKGSPQGGTISPLLANIYLNPLDWLLAELGLKSARYADDLVILATSATEAQEALERVKAWMERAQLTLHPEKTRVVDMNQSQAYFDFLGYRFWRTKKGRVARLVRPKSKKKLRESLKRPTRRTSGKCLAAIIAEINPVIRGWYAYFKQAIPGEHEKMDQWIRMRLRSILRKRNKGQGRGRGLDHFRWPNRYFEELGLVSLGRERAKELSLLRNGAKC